MYTQNSTELALPVSRCRSVPTVPGGHSPTPSFPIMSLLYTNKGKTESLPTARITAIASIAKIANIASIASNVSIARLPRRYQ